MKLSYDDLTQVFNASGEAIAHLKNNHYVVVTNISSDGKVSYVERNRGKDGYTWTVSKEDFEKSWTGYAIVSSLRGGAEGADEAISLIQSKKISDDTAQRVKGSCLPFLIPLIGMIFGAIAGAATAAVAGIGAIITGISALLAPIVSGIGALISGVANFMVGIGTAVFNAISFVGTSLLSVLGPAGSWIGGIGSFLGNAFGLGGVITSTGFNLTALGAAIGNTVVTAALSIGVSKGLEALGVNPTISNLLSSFVTGGVSGFISGGGNILSAITGGLQGLAVQGASQLGAALGLPSQITHIISNTAGMFIGAVGNNISPATGQFNLEGFSASIGKDISATIAKDISFAGLMKTFDLLGVDSRISQATSSFASSLIGNTVSGADIVTSFSRAINSSIVSVGINLLEGINPAVSAVLRSTGLMNAVENILNTSGLFEGAFNVLSRIVPTAFNAAGGLVNNIFGGAKTFVELVTESGPLGAMNDALNSLFTRQTVEAVVGQGGMESVLSNPITQVTLPDGRVVDKIALTSNASIYLGQSGEIVSIEEGGIASTGTFVWIENNKVQMKKGTIEGANIETGGYSIFADVDNGKATNIEIIDKDGNNVVKINPETPNTPININSVFNASTSEFTFTIMNALLYFTNSYMAKINNDTVESITQKINAISAGSLFNDTNKFLYALANGVSNPESDLNNPPDYITNLINDLYEQSNHNISKMDDILPIPLYQPLYQNMPIPPLDAVKWYLESQIPKINLMLTTKALKDLDAYFIRHPLQRDRSVVGMGYSGGLIPLVEAISKRMYNVKTIVGLGAATAYLKTDIAPILIQLVTYLIDQAVDKVQEVLKKILGFDIPFSGALDAVQQYYRGKIVPVVKEAFQKTIQQTGWENKIFPSLAGTKTDMIVNVWGTRDILYELGIADKRENLFGKTTYNIEIVGATHFDYMERGVNDKNKPDDWNKAIAKFVADLIINSDNEIKLKAFLDDPINHAIRDDTRGIYIVYLPGWESHQ